jgi:PTH1 family peptidyl-tRNA hydrolase
VILIVGLGNPGRRYRGTRHNIGQAVVEHLAGRLGVPLSDEGWVREARSRVAGKTVILAVPVTYMNVSGQAVRELLRRHRGRPEDLLVVHDDMDLPLGRVRLRPGGGAGGHNGVRSLIEELGTDRFPRLRIGIGRPPEGVDPVEFVLARFRDEERPMVDEMIGRAAEAALTAASRGLEAAMNRFNQRPAPAGEAVP